MKYVPLPYSPHPAYTISSVRCGHVLYTMCYSSRVVHHALSIDTVQNRVLYLCSTCLTKCRTCSSYSASIMNPQGCWSLEIAHCKRIQVSSLRHVGGCTVKHTCIPQNISVGSMLGCSRTLCL